MSALAAARVLNNQAGETIRTLGLPLATSTTFYNNGLVAANSGGYMVPATTTAGLRVAGLIDLGLHPSLVTTGFNGDFVRPVKTGIFPFAFGTSTDALTQADVLNDVYVLDDQTVGRLGTGGRPVAGQLILLEGTVAWVAIGFTIAGRSAARGGGTAYQGDGSVDAVSAAGALSVNTEISTLAVTGTTAYTLADGLFVGQKKIVTVISGASTPAGTITPAHPSGYATVSALGAIGDSALFIWTGSVWLLGPNSGVTVA